MTDSKNIKPNLTENAENSSAEITLSYINKDFLYECMSVPTYSQMEYRMVTFIILWARRNKIKCEFDEFGNIYLTKGELCEGEYYPCVTSHLDTVQDKQEPYIYAGVSLDIKTECTKEGKHKISVESYGGTPIGIGADDKSGICICLSMFEYVDKLKACFFLDEEQGCHGSEALDVNWFKDVGYVIGFDSPELYRAAWSCSGTKLFDYNFYSKYMESVCNKWGLINCFFSELYTDVKFIRKYTDIVCMNFGNGGYEAHTTSEYAIVEDMDHACGMGLDLINTIGLTKHILKDTSTKKSNIYIRLDDGTYLNSVEDDTLKLRGLGDDSRGYWSASNSKSKGSSTNNNSNNDKYSLETIAYIVDRYETHINDVKEELTTSIKELCIKSNIDFKLFEDIIKEKFNNEIKI